MGEIRGDLKEVQELIARLLAIGENFRAKDRDWSHLKNKEDWDRNIPQIKDGLKQAKVERVYCDGRDMAGFMAEALLSINHDMSSYPTLTCIIERFKRTWIDSDLDPVVEEAQRIHKELNLNCWAFNQMVSTFKDQQNLSKVVRQTLELLKESNLYKTENGLPTQKDAPNVSISNITGSNISVGSNNVSQNIQDSSAVFSKLREAIRSSHIQEPEPLLKSVDAMEGAYGTNGFAEAYKQFMSFAADHMTVFTPYIAALAALL